MVIHLLSWMFDRGCRTALPTRCRRFDLRCHPVDRLRQVEDLARQIEEFLVLPVLFLDRLPLLVGDRLTFRVGPVLADQHEGREEDRFERDDHRQQAKGVALDPEADQAAEPGQVDVDEHHRAGERGDPVGEAILDVPRPLFRMPSERRARLGREVRDVFGHVVTASRGSTPRSRRSTSRCRARASASCPWWYRR
jgi:hypothetical protein